MYLFKGFTNQIIVLTLGPKIKNIDKIFDYLGPKKILNVKRNIKRISNGKDYWLFIFSEPLLDSFPNYFSENNDNNPNKKKIIVIYKII